MSRPIDTEIRPSQRGGNGVFTLKAFGAGDVVFELARPLITALDKTRINDTCSWCFAWTELPILTGTGVNQVTKVNWCTGCKKVRYCSKKCQSQAWKDHHKRECKIFANQPELIPNTVVAVMQIMTGLSEQGARYQAISDLETHRDHFEKVGGQKWEAMRLMTHTALKFLGENEGTSKLQSTLSATCAVMCNTSRLVTSTFDPLGLSLDPLAARINHSCSPNTIIVFDGPRLLVRALTPLKNGEELTISYIDTTGTYGVRQAELRDQYFFTCACPKCKLGIKAPQDAFLPVKPGFEERIKVIDEMIPQLEKDAAWAKHLLGESPLDRQLSALQFYAYSYLESPDAERIAGDPNKLRKIITICRNSGVYPMTRAPLPAIYQQYVVACLASRRYNEALVAMLRIYSIVDPVIYPQSHHAVRVVHAWTLATLSQAVGSDPDSPFCQALQQYGVDLSMLFVALLIEVHEQVSKSHGADTMFARLVDGVWKTMMSPGGELESQYAQRGIDRSRWRALATTQIAELMPKVKAFAEDEDVAAQMDEAMTA